MCGGSWKAHCQVCFPPHAFIQTFTVPHLLMCDCAYFTYSVCSINTASAHSLILQLCLIHMLWHEFWYCEYENFWGGQLWFSSTLVLNIYRHGPWRNIWFVIMYLNPGPQHLFNSVRLKSVWTTVADDFHHWLIGSLSWRSAHMISIGESSESASDAIAWLTCCHLLCLRD